MRSARSPSMSANGRAADRENLVGTQSPVARPGGVIDIDDVEQQPRSSFQNRAAKLCDARSASSCQCCERPQIFAPMRSALIQSACTSTGFPVRGVDDPIADLRIHPRHLHAGLTGRDQPSVSQ
jgi:hypothetical protein